jgi:hypothetical protein
MEHENAQILRAIADGKNVQYSVGTVWLGSTHYGPWEDFDSSSVESCQSLLGVGKYKWRIAPKTINIAGYEVPEPCKVSLELGQDYFVPNLSTTGATRHTWAGSYTDFRFLDSNLVHLDQRSASVHGYALLEVSKGWW